MSKTFNIYENNIDKTWYYSSNIIYSECEDKVNELKTLRIVFTNGRTYEYYNVDVLDYIMFREHESQGKGFNKYIVKYEAKRIDDTDLAQLDKMLEHYKDEAALKYPNIEIVNDNIIIYLSENQTETFNLAESESKLDAICMLLNKLGIKYSEKKMNEMADYVC